MKNIKWLTLIFLIPSLSQAASDFYWSGNYSVEGNYFNGLSLGNGAVKGNKAYLNHHLVLKPEIVLFDSLSFHGLIDVLNGADSNLAPSQRVGHILGGDLSNAGTNYQSDVPEIFLNRQIVKTREANLAEAYLKFSHVNGVLSFGRIPLEFGFGAFYNKGHNPFDHWYTNRDGLSYEINIGSLYFTPKAHFLSDSLGASGSSFEYGLEFHFKVEETGLDLGGMVLSRRISADNNNSADFGANFGKATPTFYSLFYKREKKNYYYGFEAMFQNGSAGVDAAGNNVSLRGLGVAAEGQVKLGKWDLTAKAGYTDGNDPVDQSSVSSVAFHKNYNIGLILFNHPTSDAGYDPLGTNSRGRRGALSAADYNTESVADSDSVSNAMYLSPTVNYNFSDKWELSSTLVFAWLNEKNVAPGGGAVSSYLGSEVDFTLTYKPTKNIVSTTTIGYMIPGGAFEGVGGAFDTKSTFGVTTGLGISF